MKENLYRARLNKTLDKDVLEFISSLNEDIWIFEEDIIGTEAHVIMLYEQGILNKDELKRILISLEDIRRKLLKDEIELDSSQEDIHPYIEQYVIKDIGMEIGGKIHTGRSRNDQVALDIRMKIRSEINRLTIEIFALIDIIIEKSQSNINTIIPIYTHLQKLPFHP